MSGPFLSTPGPQFGRVDIHDSSGDFVTSGRARYFNLSATYTGLEVPQQEIKDTRVFVFFQNLGDNIALSYELHIGDDIWVVTSIKQNPSATEVLGLKQDSHSTSMDETGIVSIWTFGDPGDLGYDFLGANPLTAVNSPAYSSQSAPNADPQDGSVSFDDSSSERLYIDDGDHSGLDITGDFTFVCRFRLASGGQGHLCAKSDGGTQQSWEIYVSGSSKLTFELTPDGSSTTAAVGATTLGTSTWYTVACVYDGTDMRIYLNGVLDSNGGSNPASYSSGIYDGTADFAIGARSDASSFFDGLIDDCRIYNVAKSASEVLDWHNTGTT